MRRAPAGVAICVCLWLALAGSAQAARDLITGFDDGPYASANPAERSLWLDRALEARAGMIRVTVPWAIVAANPPANPADPGDPAYEFSGVDLVVRDARARGLDVLLMALGAPPWAEGANRPASASPGTWMPQAPAFGAFGRALATRYSGRFPDPLGGTLPAVRSYQAWNEPNLSDYLTPQYQGGLPASPGIYREMLNAFDAGVKAAAPANLVVSGGTAPYGDAPGGARMRPLTFLRSLLCVKNRKKLRRAPCPVKPRFDVLAHHPINTSGGPLRSAIHPDDAATPDLPQVRRVLRASERRVGLERRPHQLWVTELWWNTNPPNPIRGVNPGRQARWIEQAFYLFWKARAQVALNLQIRDAAFDPANPLASSQTGIFYVDGQAKPSLTAFRFPFVSEHLSSRRVRVWGKSPLGGRVRVQRRVGAGWRTISSAGVSSGSVFTRKLKLRGKAKLRAVIGGEASLAWALSKRLPKRRPRR